MTGKISRTFTLEFKLEAAQLVVKKTTQYEKQPA
jgi:hypothetical protein